MTGVWRSPAGEGSPARGGREREIFSTTGRYLQLSAGTLPSINGSSQPPPAATVTATTANTQPDVTSHSSTLSDTSSSSRVHRRPGLLLSGLNEGRARICHRHS